MIAIAPMHEAMTTTATTTATETETVRPPTNAEAMVTTEAVEAKPLLVSRPSYGKAKATPAPAAAGPVPARRARVDAPLVPSERPSLLVQGGSLRTWSDRSPLVEQAQVVLSTKASAHDRADRSAGSSSSGDTGKRKQPPAVEASSDDKPKRQRGGKHDGAEGEEKPDLIDADGTRYWLMPGGALFIEWSEADKHIYISGPLAQRVYSGEYMIASELMQRRHV